MKKKKKRNKTQYREDGTRIDTRTGRKRGTKTQELPSKFQPGLFQKVDGRTNLARHLRSSYQDIAADLGGEDDLSTIQKNMIERYVFLNALIQSWELQFAEDPAANESIIGRIVQAENAASGLATKLGINKKQQSRTTLQTIAQSHSR